MTAPELPQKDSPRGNIVHGKYEEPPAMVALGSWSETQYAMLPADLRELLEDILDSILK